MTSLDCPKPSKARVISECVFELQNNPAKTPEEIFAFWGFFLNISGQEMKFMLDENVVLVAGA